MNERRHTKMYITIIMLICIKNFIQKTILFMDAYLVGKSIIESMELSTWLTVGGRK